jgi:Flp pilus assembly protein TadD
VSHDPVKAVRLLNAATRSAPNNAAIWNDLAAAELARASRGDRTALTLALHAADRASALEPSSPDAYYNRALALEHLDRDREAVAAYRQALEHETSDAWRTEMYERLQRLESRS